MMESKTNRKRILSLFLAFVLSVSVLAPTAAAVQPPANTAVAVTATASTVATTTSASKTKVDYGASKYSSLTKVDYGTYHKLDYQERSDKYTCFYDFRDTWYAGCDNADAPTRPSFAGRRTKLLSDQQGFWGIRASTEEDVLSYEAYTYLDHVTVSGIEFRTYDNAECIVLDDTPNETFTRTTTNLENSPYTLCIWFDYTYPDGTVESIGTWQPLYVSDGKGMFADFAYSKSDDLFESWLSKQYESLSADDLLQAWVAKQGGNDFDKATDVSAIHYPFKSGTSRYPDETAKWRQLAHEICPDDDANDYVKARALFGWMQSNIAYDRDALPYTGGSGDYRWATAAGSAKGYTMWDSHLGQCVDFVNAYAVMCRELDIPCHVVSIPSHGFNVAYLNGRWEIVDVNTGIREANLGADNKDYAANVEAYWAKEDAKGGHTPVWNGFCDTAASKFKVGSYEKDKYTGVGDKMAKTLNELNYELQDDAYFRKWSGTVYGH